MRSVRQDIGGLGNIMFKNAYLWAQMRDGNIPDIYVQSPKYFQKYADEIRTLYGSGITTDNRIALHIRRGDYLKVHQFHTNLWETDYYKKAIEHFRGERFLVFCKDNQSEAQDEDDRIWCLDNLPFLLPPKSYDFHEHTTETEDLNAMASCKGIITANSSFSWWAAFLGNPTKKVVAPKETRWFVDQKVRTELPDNWLKI